MRGCALRADEPLSARFLLPRRPANEIADRDADGPAHTWVRRNRRAQLWISPVTLAEILEGAEDPDAIKAYLDRFAWQGIHRIQAETAALIQRRADDRLGENDAWQVTVAKCMKAKLLGHDDAFRRFGAAYEDPRPA
jgi:predicted nucleic acid-binding protein